MLADDPLREVLEAASQFGDLRAGGDALQLLYPVAHLEAVERRALQREQGLEQGKIHGPPMIVAMGRAAAPDNAHLQAAVRHRRLGRVRWHRQVGHLAGNGLLDGAQHPGQAHGGNVAVEIRQGVSMGDHRVHALQGREQARQRPRAFEDHATAALRHLGCETAEMNRVAEALFAMDQNRAAVQGFSPPVGLREIPPCQAEPFVIPAPFVLPPTLLEGSVLDQGERQVEMQFRVVGRQRDAFAEGGDGFVKPARRLQRAAEVVGDIDVGGIEAVSMPICPNGFFQPPGVQTGVAQIVVGDDHPGVQRDGAAVAVDGPVVVAGCRKRRGEVVDRVTEAGIQFQGRGETAHRGGRVAEPEKGIAEVVVGLGQFRVLQHRLGTDLGRFPVASDGVQGAGQVDVDFGIVALQRQRPLQGADGRLGLAHRLQGDPQVDVRGIEIGLALSRHGRQFHGQAVITAFQEDRAHQVERVDVARIGFQNIPVDLRGIGQFPRPVQFDRGFELCPVVHFRPILPRVRPVQAVARRSSAIFLKIPLPSRDSSLISRP